MVLNNAKFSSPIFLLLCLCSPTLILAQKVSDPEPIGGMSKLALPYFKINFTREQRSRLDTIELELIYDLDENGNARLEKVNGIEDHTILDSLFNVTPLLPKFEPRKVDGKNEPSLFFMRLKFPSYREIIEDNNLHSRKHLFKNPSFSDYEYINKSGHHMDMLLGGVMNNYAGNAHKYLGTGGGMKLDLMINGPQGFGWGMVMSVYGNRLKKKYPVNSPRQQNQAPPTMLLGITGNKSIYKRSRHELTIQTEICYAVQNVITKENIYDKQYVQFRGFSPGVAANYVIQLGRERSSSYYGRPAIISNNINLHAALRSLLFNKKEASGLMMEVGVSYRMRTHFIQSFKLKPEFYE